MELSKNDDIAELRENLGSETYNRIYNTLYCRARRMQGKRNSGKDYENPPERIQLLKEKYKNGVSLSDINKMLGVV